MKVIGITGGVGSGKSEVLNYLEKRQGIYVCQADQVAKELQQKGTECFHKIVEYFGEEIVGEDGQLDRKKLADIVFNNENELHALNAIVHPAVAVRIDELIKVEQEKGTRIFILETALLIETGYNKICDEVWFVYTNDEVRKKRLKLSRGYSEEKTDAIFRSQKTKEEFLAYCDRVIDNSRSFEETCVQLLHIIDKF